MTPSSPARPKPKSFRCFNVNLTIMVVCWSLLLERWLLFWYLTNWLMKKTSRWWWWWWWFHWKATFYGQSSIVHQRRWFPRNNSSLNPPSSNLNLPKVLSTVFYIYKDTVCALWKYGSTQIKLCCQTSPCFCQSLIWDISRLLSSLAHTIPPCTFWQFNSGNGCTFWQF